MPIKHIIGIDVSKNTLDIYLSHQNKSIKITNSPKAIHSFISSLDNPSNYIFFYEATGIYMTNLIKVCNDLHLVHYQLHPTLSQKLAESISDRNKTDEIDAIKIADIGALLLEQFEQTGRHKLTLPNSNLINEFKTIISFIHSLKNDIARFKNRIEYITNSAFSDKDMAVYYQKQIELFKDQVQIRYDKLETQIDKAGYGHKIAQLETIPCISKTGAFELFVFFLELEMKGFTSHDRSKLKAYVGIDPSKKQSGTSLNSQKVSKKGKRQIRGMLFILSLTWFNLVKHNKYQDTQLGQFFLRMKTKFSTPTNKRGKSICTAMSKKILFTSRGVYRGNQDYNRG